MRNEMDLPTEMEGMFLIETLMSPLYPNTGVMVMGENYEEDSTQPIVRIYLITVEGNECFFETEMQAFAFNSIKSAKQFVSDLPNMSAIDILMRMSGYQTHNAIGDIIQ